MSAHEHARAHLAALRDVTLPAGLNMEDLLTSHVGRHPDRHLPDPGVGRILVAGCGRGWQLWTGDPLAETGVIVAPNGPLTAYDPRPAGTAGDVRFFSIRDPRQAVTRP